MGTTQIDLDERLRRLERVNRRNNLIFLGMGLTLAVFTASGFSNDEKEVKTRQLTIIDEQGRPRMILAGKVPDPKEGQRRTTGPGMQILNEKGYEQFGLHVDDKGGVGMGLDAKEGVGDDRNRERINLWVTPSGMPGIRLMDGKTRVKSMWYLDNKEEAWLGFLRWSDVDKKITYTGEKKIGLTTEESKPPASNTR